MKKTPRVETCAFLLGAGATLFQSFRNFSLFDWGFHLEVIHRLSLGQKPYVDFIFAHGPLTYLSGLLFHSLFGKSLETGLAYMVVLSGFSSWLAVRWFLRKAPELGRFEKAAVILTCALLNPYAGMVAPYHDNALCLAVLVLLNLSESQRTSALLGSGVVAALLPWIKLNVGLPLAGFWVAWELIELIYGGRTWQQSKWRIGGFLVTLSAIAVGIERWVGWDVYFQSTVVSPAKVRLPFDALQMWASNFLFPIWGVGFGSVGALAYVLSRKIPRLSQIFDSLWIIALTSVAVRTVLVFDRPDIMTAATTTWRVLPFVLLFFALARFVLVAKDWEPLRWSGFLMLTYLTASLALGLESLCSYSLLLGVFLLRYCQLTLSSRKTFSFSIVLILVCAAFVYGHQDQLDYLSNKQYFALRSPVAEVNRRSQEILHWIDTNLKKSEPFVAYPGEDPVFFLSGRVPRFPVVQFDWTSNPYDFSALIREFDRTGIRYVFVEKETAVQLCPIRCGVDYERTTMGQKLLALDRARLVADLQRYYIFKLSPPVPHNESPPPCPDGDREFLRIQKLMTEIRRPELSELTARGFGAAGILVELREYSATGPDQRVFVTKDVYENPTATTFEDQLGRPARPPASTPDSRGKINILTQRILTASYNSGKTARARFVFSENTYVSEHFPARRGFEMIELDWIKAGWKYYCQKDFVNVMGCSCKKLTAETTL